jgi:hypothetical protein
MKFNMFIECQSVSHDSRKSETVVEDFYSLIAVSCEDVLGPRDCRLRVSGFGDDDWPTDIWTLSSVLEDLPDILDDLRGGRASSIQFASQATERTVHLAIQNERVTMTCEGWHMPPSSTSVEIVEADELMTMLIELGHSFAELLFSMNEELARTEPLPEWHKGKL